MATRIQILRGTAAEWIADDIIVPQGEFALEVDGSNVFTGLIKIGDGVSVYSALPGYTLGGATNIKFEAWSFDVATADADPGSGNMRFDNASTSLTTFIYVSNQNAQGQDVSEILDDLNAGSNIAMQQVSNIAKAALFDVSGPVVDAGTYRKIPVTFVSEGGGGAFDDTEVLGWSIFPEGGSLVSSDEPERIDFEDNLDTQYQSQYLTPIQITDITSNGISTITYSAAPDDGTYDFAGNIENDNIANLNTYLDGLGDAIWVVIQTNVVLSRASSIRRIKNVS